MKGTVKRVGDMAFTPEYIETSDLNTLATSGCYQVSGTNSNHVPQSGYSYYVIHIRSSDNYATQIAFRFGGTPYTFLRNKNNGSWGSWYYVNLGTVEG